MCTEEPEREPWSHVDLFRNYSMIMLLFPERTFTRRVLDQHWPRPLLQHATRYPWTFHTLMCVCVCVVALLILAHRTVVCTSSLLPGTRQCFWEFKYFQRVGGSPITVYNHIQMGVRAAHVFISTDTNYYFILLHLVISLSHTHDFIIICLLWLIPHTESDAAYCN